MLRYQAITVWWRCIVVGAFVISAVVTPDAISQTLVMISVMVLTGALAMLLSKSR